MRKQKAQISFAVTAKLISTFVLATRIAQSLLSLNPKFQAPNHLLWQYRPVCVRHGQKLQRLVFLHCGSYSLIFLSSELVVLSRVGCLWITSVYDTMTTVPRQTCCPGYRNSVSYVAVYFSKVGYTVIPPSWIAEVEIKIYSPDMKGC